MLLAVRGFAAAGASCCLLLLLFWSVGFVGTCCLGAGLCTEVMVLVSALDGALSALALVLVVLLCSMGQLPGMVVGVVKGGPAEPAWMDLPSKVEGTSHLA